MLLWVLGVVLPLVALGHELRLGWCRDALFDPLPSPAHLVLVAWVPAANLMVLLALRRPLPSGRRPPCWRRWTFLRLGNGLALGVTTFYALVFLPLVPVSVVAVLFYGLGLLSLSPLLALFATLGLGRRLRAAAEDSAPVAPIADRPVPPRRLATTGFAVGLVLLIGAALPQTLTEWAVDHAANGSPRARERALWLLRAAADRAVMLRLCYVRRGQMSHPLGFALGLLDDVDRATPERAREVFFRVTGEDFARVPPPDLASLRGQRLLELDLDQGGSVVGGAVADLELVDSSIAASLDADAALGYLEWTLELRNAGETQREGRTVVALPPGGVVSRATLWIGGEPREAAFGGHGEVRDAYERVVRTRRDPLLVTTSGTDRVLVQCFPVSAHGRMKIRLGMTTPLTVTAAERAELDLPFFAERNFALADGLRHRLEVDADQPLTLVGAREAHGGDSSRPATVLTESTPWRGALDDAQLASTHIAIRRTMSERSAWASDPADPARLVVQRLEPRAAASKWPVIVVLDGSHGMASHLAAVREVLASRPGLRILFAGDTVVEELSPAALEGLDDADFVGGRDNVAALELAWERADSLARQADTAPLSPRIVWVHGPQPVLLTAIDGLAARCAAGHLGSSTATALPEIVALSLPSAGSAPNRVLDGLRDCRQISIARPRGAFVGELRRLVSGAAVDRAGWTARRSLEILPPLSSLAVDRTTSGHLVRLWQQDEVARLARVDPDAAVALAVEARLVTPWSGAVVLETAEQYTPPLASIRALRARSRPSQSRR